MFISEKDFVKAISYVNLVANFYTPEDDIDKVRLGYDPVSENIGVALISKYGNTGEMASFHSEKTVTGRKLFKEFFDGKIN